MARKAIERNISYDDARKKYYVNLDFGLDPETGKQVKKSKTFGKLTEARAALIGKPSLLQLGRNLSLLQTSFMDIEIKNTGIFGDQNSSISYVESMP